jgi:predicted phosphate transport protein (TIGR00153 family)
MLFVSKQKEIQSQISEYCESVLESAEKLFTDFTNAAVAVGKIDELESEGDRIEASLIEKVFAEKVDSISTIVFRDFIKCIVQISDRAENVGDKIRIIVAKRAI